MKRKSVLRLPLLGCLTFLAAMYTACTQPDSLTFQQDELTEMIRTDGLEKVVQNYETSLAENPENDQAREMLKRLVTGSYGISHDESLRLRNIIRNYTRQATTVLVPPDEPGEPLIVSGTIRDTGGQPIAGALMYVFHADAKGYYTPDRPMDEPNARLFGYMKTAADGCYQFRTIRPGGYPQAPIPQHIHMTVTAPGYRDHKCRSTCQLVFEDDPRMTAEWQAWAEKGGNPVLSVTRDQDGVRKCVYDIVLERN